MPDDVKALDEQRRALFAEVGQVERKLVKVQLAVQELSQIGGDLAAKEERDAQLARELEAVPAGYDAARHVVVRQELDRLMPIDARAPRLPAQGDRAPGHAREHAQLREQIVALATRIDALRTRRDAVTVPEAEFNAKREDFERASTEMRAVELTVVQAESDAQNAASALEVAERSARDLADRQRLLSDLNDQKRLHDELDRAYTDLRTDLNFQLRPELSEIASAFLSDLTDGRYGELELDDNYDIKVLEDGVPKPVISGGEEDLANLVLRLAISQMIAERAGQPFALLVLDEIFGSLDELHRESVLDLLRRLQDRFEQVILITHIESVRDMLDHVVMVRFNEETGASVVTQEEGVTLPPAEGGADPAAPLVLVKAS
jgi:exonuclease SbcC